MSESPSRKWLRQLARDEIVKKAFWLIPVGLITGGGLIARSDVSAVGASGFVIASVVAAAWGAAEVSKRRSFRRPYYPRVKFPYEVLEKHVSYEIGEDGSLLYRRRFRIKALTDVLSTFVDKFQWTAGTSPFPTPGTGVSAVNPLSKAGIWTYYTVSFDQSLHRNQVFEFELEWPPIDDWRAASPFVSISTEEPTRLVSFSLTIPSGALANSDAYAEVTRGIEASHTLETSKMAFDAHGHLAWTAPSKLYRHYRLRWAWSGTKAVEATPEVVSGGSPDGS